MEMATLAWYHAQGDGGARPVHWPVTCTGPSHWTCTHVQNSRMPPARLQLQLTRAGPSHHEPRLTQLELAVGAMHMARPGARRASHERAGPRACANQQRCQCAMGKAAARAGQHHSPGGTEPTSTKPAGLIRDFVSIDMVHVQRMT